MLLSSSIFFFRKLDILPCPYGKKCTYGNKCKFSHPERGSYHKSVTEKLSEHAARHLSARNSSTEISTHKVPIQGKSLSVPLSSTGNQNIIVPEQLIYGNRKPLCRSKMTSNTSENQKIPKSHSIENVSPIPQSLQTYARQSATSLADDVDDTVNLHKKLQRQLTLNPYTCDPRNVQLKQHKMACNSSAPIPQSTRPTSKRGSYCGYLTHSPLVSSSSIGPAATYLSQPWENDPTHPVSRFILKIFLKNYIFRAY